MKAAFCIAIVLLMAGAAAAQDLDGIDQTSTSRLTPRTWEPIIPEFYAATSTGEAALVTPPRENPRNTDVLGEVAQWQVLKPLIAPRGDDVAGIGSYTANESVLSAWHRTFDDSGQVEFRTYGSNGAPTAADATPKPMIHAIYCKDHIIRLMFDLDILMNEKDPDKKEQIVNDYFKIAQLSLTARKISDDPANFRGGVPGSPNPSVYRIVNVGKPDEPVGEDFRASAHSWSSSRQGVSWNFLAATSSEVGVFEYRVKARVNGRFSSQEDYASKTVEGAIRVAFVNNKSIEVIKISGESARKPGQVDVIKNGRVVQTRDKTPGTTK